MIPSTDTLDEVLTLQLLLAWMGESAGPEAPRLGWWQTDVVDEGGGGDLMKRLLPRTHGWASLHAARKAAQLTDERVRRPQARSDEMVTLFHFGFELDEAVDDRLRELKLSGALPQDALPRLRVMGDAPKAAELENLLSAKQPRAEFKIVPGGRQLTSPSAEPASLALQLALTALDGTPKEYPLPFALTETPRAQR